MRHRKTVKKLGRTAAHRKAMLANLSSALFERKHIITTEAKAKETRRVSERLITLAKKESVHARRLALKKLRSKKVVKILFDEVAPRYADRNGGYTRVIKLGQRQGDAARMAVVELVGYDTAIKKKKDKDAKTEAEDSKKKKSKAEQPKAEEVKEEKEVKKKSSKKDEESKKTIKKAKSKKETDTKDKKKKDDKKGKENK